MPKFEMAQDTGTLVEWLYEEGQEVEKGEPLLVVETDKVTIEVEAPASGILDGIQANPGDVVPVTEVIAYVREPGEDLRPAQVEQAQDSPAEVEPRHGMEVTPVARRLGESLDLDLSEVEGSGPGGRITKVDIEEQSEEPVVASPAAGTDAVRATPAARRIAGEHGVDLSAVPGTGPHGRIYAVDVEAYAEARRERAERAAHVIPLEGMRKTIAERMTASYRSAPHITFTIRANMAALERARVRINERSDRTDGVHISATALIVKAVGWALRQHLWLNSRLEDGDIHVLSEINVGVAVALKEGLIVPVVRDVDCKGITEIATEINDLTRRARDGRLTPSDVVGGTFTVSNLGPFGIEAFTAIINPPEAAILAVGAIQQEAVVMEDGNVAARPVMRMTLSADHRIVDGAIAARFLRDLRQALEVPMTMLTG
jgi:pyruvate dehydrogenase E2 component (dihydrolipoamide acetyltransferase)